MDMQQLDSSASLFFPFQGRKVPVTHSCSIPNASARAAVESKQFIKWYKRCEDIKDGKRIDIHSVDIQSVDMFGTKVGFIKLNAHCTWSDGNNDHDHALPGICLLRGDSVAIFVAIFDESDTAYALLVEQPRIPVGRVSFWEVPAGMIEGDAIKGTAVQEIQEECGIEIRASELVDLTALAYQDTVATQINGITLSPGGCDESIRLMYLEKKATKNEVEELQGRLTGLREEGEYIALRLVPLDTAWRTSGDAKALMCQFLLQELRETGKLPRAGMLATPLTRREPILHLHSGAIMPQLAFGLYKVPNDEDGVETILNAIRAGYRHFDSAPIYGNEAALGNALRKCGIPRSCFFITSKVWNDAVRNGQVQESVQRSLQVVGCEYFDLYLVHWPVPGHFVDAYKVLEQMYFKGKLKSVGLSNFSPEDYEELLKNSITIQPSVNQIEASPMMYRQEWVSYFQSKGIIVYAHKSLNRATGLEASVLLRLAAKYFVTSAQIMLRWGLQKGFVLATKTSERRHMDENRDILNFTIADDDMAELDSLTTEQDIKNRAEIENSRKTSI